MPLAFLITEGQRHDSTVALLLLEGKKGMFVLCDRAYDAEKIRATISGMLTTAVIPSPTLRKKPIPHDTERYNARNCIERFFNWLKQWRGLATRYIKRGRYFLQSLFLAAVVLRLKNGI